MRVLIVNTSERTGGAAVAANRLMRALNDNGVKAKMLVREKETTSLTVVGLPKSFRLHLHFLWERWCIFWHLRFSRKHLFELDIANAGTDITVLPEFKEADIIHLHWINQGMLSLRIIRKILDSGKPVVWTMHDIWPATSICHLTLGCRKFESRCTDCGYLPSTQQDDLASAVWKKKARMLSGSKPYFVACSRWLAEESGRSALLKDCRVTNIPNPIDTDVFSPGSREASRIRLGLPLGKRLIIFVSQRVTNRNKGMSFLVEACRKWTNENPEVKETTGVVILGGHSEELAAAFDFPVYSLGYVNDPDKMADAYRACNVFVLPSLSENLPNTIMEAMSCGVPCVGFDVGGIPEEIDHLQNGYVAKYKDADDLKCGLRWVLDESDYDSLSRNAVSKVAHSYSRGAVASKYIDIYNKVLNEVSASKNPIA